MSITNRTSNERNMILERALMGFLSLMLISVGKAVTMSIALKLGTKWSMTIKNEMNDTDYPNTK